jgi:hypothetical protein
MGNGEFSAWKEVASVIRLGSGLLGKSAIVIGFLIICVGIALFRLHNDLYIFGALVFGAVVFFAWFIPIIRFADKHPDAALLEGAQWAQHQRDQLAAKGMASLPASPIIPAPNSAPPLLNLPQEPEK